MSAPDPKLLDELARIYARAAVDQLLAEAAAQAKAPRRDKKPTPGVQRSCRAQKTSR
jgi:hypothetical protein